MAFATILDAGFMQDIEKPAMDYIKKERAQYTTVYTTIESYCAKYKLILSNKYVLCDMVDAKNNVYNKIYRVYTSNPLRHANDLTNIIYEQMKDDKYAAYTRMKTLKENEEFSIEYNLRQMVVICKVQKHKQTEPIELIKPVDIEKLLYMPSEIELIDVYHTLYDPSQYCDWGEAEEFEKRLFDQVLQRKDRGILGAGNCKERKKHALEAMKIDIVLRWLPDQSDTILLGPWACDWLKYGKKICVQHGKIQLISNMTPDKLLQQLKKFAAAHSKFDVSMREQELHIPKDFRTTRTTYYIHVDTPHGITEKPFLDLFNSAAFEVVPCVQVDGVSIGTRYVLLRFLFIDLWVIRIIKGMGLLSASILQKKIDELWTMIEFIREQYTFSDQITHIGTYRNAAADKKISGMKGKMFFPYYPHVYLEQNNKYRSI